MLFNLITGIMLIGEGELYTNTQLICIFIGNIVCITGIFLKMSVLEAYDPNAGTGKDASIAEEDTGDEKDFNYRR